MGWDQVGATLNEADLVEIIILIFFEYQCQGKRNAQRCITGSHSVEHQQGEDADVC